MRDFYQSWLDQHRSRPGVLMCGISLPDNSCLGCSSGPDYPLEKLQEILRHVGEFSGRLAQQRLGATRLLWTFEGAQLHWTVRRDKVSLALLTPADSTGWDPAAIEGLIGEFLQLRPQK